jgi:hypothetical protein
LIYIFTENYANTVGTGKGRNNEPDGIENATRNSSGEKPGHLQL